MLLAPLAARVAPAWKLSRDELQSLADSWADVLDKWFPDLEIGVELSAALVTFAILGPRWSTPRVLAPAETKTSNDEAPSFRSSDSRPPDPPPKPGVIPAHVLAGS
jgi:hypothetical protein